VYATGTVLYELLSGQLPFSEEGEPLEILERRVTEDPVPLSEAGPQVPGPLVDVTMRALQREPDERYPSAEAFGVAVGTAATDAFGAGWLGRANVTLLATGTIGAAAGPALSTTTDTDDDVMTPLAGRAGGETFVSGATMTPESRVRVRETTARGAALADLRPEDLVRVDDLISPPKPPWWSCAAAALLFLVMIVVAAIGFSEPTRSGTLPPGLVTVDGVDLGTNDSVSADLSDPIPVTVEELPADAAGATYAQFGFSAAGVGLGTSRSAPLEPDGGGFSADVNAERIKILSSGDLTAEFRLLDEEKQKLVQHEFALDPEAPFFLTATGLAGLLLALFVISYGLSITAPLRRGYSRRSAYVGLPILGAVAGVAATLLAWSLGAGEPSGVTFVVAAVLGAASFFFLTRATIVEGRRVRLRRAEERADAAA
jgi:serine/threonine-protein kinase